MQEVWYFLYVSTITEDIHFNPFPNTPFLGRSKFKEAADDNWNVAIKGF